MPDTTVLEITPRAELRKQNRALRARGGVPAVIYGHRVDPVPVTLPRREFERAFHKVGRTQLLDLKIDGEGGSRKVLVREASFPHLPAHSVHRRVRLCGRRHAYERAGGRRQGQGHLNERV